VRVTVCLSLCEKGTLLLLLLVLFLVWPPPLLLLPLPMLYDSAESVDLLCRLLPSRPPTQQTGRHESRARALPRSHAAHRLPARAHAGLRDAAAAAAAVTAGVCLLEDGDVVSVRLFVGFSLSLFLQCCHSRKFSMILNILCINNPNFWALRCLLDLLNA
jgi:hypothetical protein